MCHCEMKFRTGDTVETPYKSIGVIQRYDTEYMEPLYEVEFPCMYLVNDVSTHGVQKQWFMERDLKLVSASVSDKECPICHGTGKVLLFNTYVKCKECS